MALDVYFPPDFGVLKTCLEVVDGELFTNLVFGNRYTYSGEGVIISGRWIGLGSFMGQDQDVTSEELVEFFFAPEDMQCVKVPEISKFL